MDKKILVIDDEGLVKASLKQLLIIIFLIQIMSLLIKIEKYKSLLI